MLEADRSRDLAGELLPNAFCYTFPRAADVARPARLAAGPGL